MYVYFEKESKNNIEQMTLNKYIPSDWFYPVLKESKDGFIEKKHIEVKMEIGKDKKTKSLNIFFQEQSKISKLYYHCKLTDEIIDNYYKILKNTRCIKIIN